MIGPMELEAEWPREPYAESLTRKLEVSDLSTCSALCSAVRSLFFFSSMPLMCSSLITVASLIVFSLVWSSFHSRDPTSGGEVEGG